MGLNRSRKAYFPVFRPQNCLRKWYIKIKVSPRFEGIFFTKTHVEKKTKGKQSKNDRMKKGKIR